MGSSPFPFTFTFSTTGGTNSEGGKNTNGQLITCIFTCKLNFKNMLSFCLFSFLSYSLYRTLVRVVHAPLTQFAKMA